MSGWRIAMALPVIALAAACSSPAAQPLPVVGLSTAPLASGVTTSAAPTTTAAPTTAAPTTTTPAPPPLNGRGNIELPAGGAAGASSSAGVPEYTITVRSIAVGATCAATATRGQFLLATLVLDTAPGLDVNAPVPPAASALTVVAPDGTVTGDLATSAATECDPGQPRSPVSVKPGANYSFAMVLDSPAAKGSLAYHPDGQAHGWEWPFPS